jgi:hypothetical protein
MRSSFLLAATAGVAALLVNACGYPDPTAGNGGPVAAVPTTGPSQATGIDDFNEGAGKTPVRFPDGLQILDLKVGDGDTVKAGATVKARYTGWLSNGQKFDSSADHGGTPLCAILSNTQQQNGDCTTVIPGWTEGVPGMKVGGRRKLTIPASLGYGNQGIQGVIPPGSTLVFTIQIDSIVAQSTPTPSPTPTAPPTPSLSPSPTK